MKVYSAYVEKRQVSVDELTCRNLYVVHRVEHPVSPDGRVHHGETHIFNVYESELVAEAVAKMINDDN